MSTTGQELPGQKAQNRQYRKQEILAESQGVEQVSQPDVGAVSWRAAAQQEHASLVGEHQGQREHEARQRLAGELPVRLGCLGRGTGVRRKRLVGRAGIVAVLPRKGVNRAVLDLRRPVIVRDVERRDGIVGHDAVGEERRSMADATRVSSSRPRAVGGRVWRAAHDSTPRGAGFDNACTAGAVVMQRQCLGFLRVHRVCASVVDRVWRDASLTSWDGFTE
jgi:hypothetical protein